MGRGRGNTGGKSGEGGETVGIGRNVTEPGGVDQRTTCVAEPYLLLNLADGWPVRPGPRAGDLVVAR